MRKPLTVAVATLFALSFLVACGASGDDEATDETTTTTEAAAGPEDTEPEDTEPDETTTSVADDTTTTEAGSGDDDVEQWATDFCGPFTAWLESIDEAGTEVQSAEADSLEEGKVLIVDLFDTAKEETDSLIDSIETTGPPPIDDGEALLGELVGIFGDFNGAIDSARAEIEGVDTNDAAAFEQDVQDAVTTFQEEIGEVSESFTQLDQEYPSPELDQALTAACDF
ncbi:hypothetical protein BH20ACT3_BH20ACT3_01090 [soil metagenome]